MLPLTWAAVSDAWGAVATKHGRVRDDSRRLERLVDELADAGLVQRDIGAAKVWPVAAARVVFVGAAPISEWATVAGAMRERNSFPNRARCAPPQSDVAMF